MKLGKAFSDSVIVQKSERIAIGKSLFSQWWLGTGRVLLFTTVFFLILFVLFWRLFFLTIIHGHEYRVLADGNRTRELVRHAPRGILYDRTGRPLVENIVQFRLSKPCEKKDQEGCVSWITEEEGKALEQKGIPAGWYLERDFLRRYLFSDSLSHVVGYTGEISEAELNQSYYKDRRYQRGDRIGRMGAEAVYEDTLHGRDGKELVEVDATGKIVRTLGRDIEVSGQDVTLSLDSGLSDVVSKAFPIGEKGAVVVTKPSTGEILALYSSPSFSSNAFSYGLSTSDYERLVNDPQKPMFDRAIGGTYPPGSTFKIVTALAALEEKAITKTTTVEDSGVITIGPFTFPNWYFIQYGKTEGAVDIVKAIQRSNDIFFYKTGEWLGITKLVSWAKKIGLGKPLGIELSGESSGLMPDPAWKNERFTSDTDRQARNNEWYLGDTYHVAIGQGYLLTTPLQVNAWTNLIANKGKVCRPSILKSQNSMIRTQKTPCKDLGIKPETIKLIAEGMRKACETGGTGWPLFNFSIKKQKASESQRVKVSENEATSDADTVIPSDTLTLSVPLACKTGTAEFGDPHNKTHAWFTVYAPLPADSAYVATTAKEAVPQSGTKEGVSRGTDKLNGEPEISITVLVEGAGEGSNVAAPVAKKILEEWFGR